MKIFLKQTLMVASMALAYSAVAAPAKPIPDVGDVAIQKIESGLPQDWYKKGVFIEIYVRGYQDSNGDGKGDFKGLTSRLDYLKSLGVTGIWLMPTTVSKDHDHGYAVTNYRDVEPNYGTLADFDVFIAEAHKRGIGVIMDYVMNHSSSSHPIFNDADEDAKSPYRSWYNFELEQPEGWNGYAGDPWHQAQHGYFYGVFSDSMPDWNLKNPDVIKFHHNNLKFWLNRGVDGFRFDATGVLVENSKVGWENQPENHQIMKGVHDLLGEYGNKYLVCEAPSDPAAFSGKDSCGSAFSFGLQKYIIKSIKFGKVSPDVEHFLSKLPVAEMGTILANHDSFAGSRLMKQFANNEKEYRLATATLLTLPGIPFIYYGEEIGMDVSQSGYEDQEIRGPMSWSNERKGAGFSVPKKNIFRTLADNFETNNVEAQEKDPASLLNFYRALIALRKAEPALQTGNYVRVPFADQSLFAFTRNLNGQSLLVVLNYSEKPITANLKLDKTLNGSLAAVYPSTEKELNAKKGAVKISLPASGFAVYRLK